MHLNGLSAADLISTLPFLFLFLFFVYTLIFRGKLGLRPTNTIILIPFSLSTFLLFLYPNNKILIFVLVLVNESSNHHSVEISFDANCIFN